MRTNQLKSLAVAFLMMFAGCAGSSSTSSWPERRPLGREYETFEAPARVDVAASPASDVSEPTGIVSLEHALSMALLANPDLAALSWEVRAAEARALQAGLRPNPEIEIEIEEFGGAGERRGLDGATITPRLSQLIELGGKRSKRARVAALETELARWDYEAARLAAVQQVKAAFVSVLSAQERLALAEERVDLSEQIFRAVSERVNAGKVSPLEETKAAVALSTSRIQRERAGRDLTVARERLAATWGGVSPSFDRVEGRLEDLPAIPSRDDLASLVSENPEIARWDAVIKHRRAVAEMERAGRIPDLTLSGGVQRFNETDDHAFVVEVSVPIPLFDRNQGSVLEARRDLGRGREERRAAEVNLQAALTEAYEGLAAASAEALSLRNVVLPAAERAFQAAEEGYRRGKLGYLDVLDAQRTYFEVKGHWVDALTACHTAAAEVERLVGESLP